MHCHGEETFFITATSMGLTSWMKQDFLIINCHLTGLLALVLFSVFLLLWSLDVIYMYEHEDPSSIPRTHIKEASVVAHTCNSWGGGAGSWGLGGQPLRGISEAQAGKHQCKRWEPRGWSAPGPLGD